MDNTTANQTDLTDGVYQFKAIVTDVAGTVQRYYLPK
jgi:hypothetical protein